MATGGIDQRERRSAGSDDARRTRPRSRRQRLMFTIMYRLGFVPWEGHPLPARLRAIADEPAKGRALDIGCGTGEASVFLAGAGWDVTGADFVDAALERARARAAAAGVRARFVQADATRLTEANLGGPFDLIFDGGLLHGLSDSDRDAYVRGLAAVAAPGARLLVAAYPAGAQRLPRGIDPDEVERRFAPEWEIVSAGPEPDLDLSRRGVPINFYEMIRRS